MSGAACGDLAGFHALVGSQGNWLTSSRDRSVSRDGVVFSHVPMRDPLFS